MLDDRTGPKPHSLCLDSHGSAGSRAQVAAVGRGYLLLIDRESPLSSLGRRR